MKEITVQYLISDENEQRLQKITDKYKEHGLVSTPERVFQSIMLVACEYDIDQKFKLVEETFGLRKV